MKSATKSILGKDTLVPLNETDEHDFLVPVQMPFRLPTPIYGAMLAIWHLRPVLQRRFPLHCGKARAYVRFLAWCATEGRRQYAILRLIPDWDAALSLPISLPALKGDCWAGGFSVAMFLFGVAKYHYTVGPMLRDARVRHRVARAYWRGGRHNCLLPPPAKWNCDFLANQFDSEEALLAALRIRKKDSGKDALQLCKEFGIDDVRFIFQKKSAHNDETRFDLFPHPERVLLPPNIHYSPATLPLRVIRSLSWVVKRFSPRPTEFQLGGITVRITSKNRRLSCSPYPFGVNLFGYAKGEIGIGEDVRLVALALQAQNIPFCIVNVQLSPKVSQQDASVDQWIVNKPRYAINIFCITGIEQTRYACEQGLEVFQGRYNIGFWPWELPNWPASCNHAFSLVDEIWGISRYTANAYRNAPCPVYAMSLPITISQQISLENRAHFGLPADDYLFVFSFDFNSTISRKNPDGVVRAFQCAFPQNKNERVGLVLKASHVDANNKQWGKLMAIVKADPRIHVIDTTLRRPQVLALYRCCDCYVSLHRAEGFGRCLAEALMLDLQLIATAFSGNLDFCSREQVGLVRYTLRDLDPKEYFFSQGQQWAEPDIDHAAEVMRDTYMRPRKARPVTLDFSPTTVGTRYAQRLRTIQQQLELEEERN